MGFLLLYFTKQQIVNTIVDEYLQHCYLPELASNKCNPKISQPLFWTFAEKNWVLTLCRFFKAVVIYEPH